MPEKLPPPNDPDAFESFCLDLFRVLWGDPEAKKNGRSGQEQAGVDVYGTSEGSWVGVQCKQKDLSLRRWVTAGELAAEVGKARGFRPALGKFLLATTGPRDARVQERARELSDEGGFPVEVWCWDDLWHEVVRRPEFFARIFPVYWPLLAGVDPQPVAGTRLRHATDRLFGRETELAALDAAWANPSVHVLTLVAWGGVGKTALVANWFAKLAARNFDEAAYFDWSFYSQGTGDQRNASADPFVDAALRHFGDAETADSARSPEDKGARLAQRIGERRVLLVLDGLEPLQHPPGPLAGELKDPAMKALLRGLAVKNAGLCVVTTRERVEDLKGFEGSTAPRRELEHLSIPAGVELLRTRGVAGTPANLEAAVQDVKGHALTLTLLGNYLAHAHRGDVRKRDLVRLAEADENEQGGHAFRVMEAYERWLVPKEGFLKKAIRVLRRAEPPGPPEGRQQLAVLRLLGLFDRPASGELLGVLRKPPAIPGLTDSIAGLSEAQWNLAVSRLAECGLVVRDGNGFDAHPLVREHFGRKIRVESEGGFQAAHGRLFDHLKDTTERWPETLEGLQPLYQAVVHGCLAGRQQEACDRVYWDRIQRGREAFSTTKLGAISADLGAVACFFDPPWSRVSPALTEADQAWLLNEAAFSLRALGRLTEAVEPMRVSIDSEVEQRRWKRASTVASNLSELELTLGDVAGAVRNAERSVDFADRSSDASERMINRTTLADALHQAGRREEALARFREAEAMQAERQPKYPRLYSLRGFQYCDLLLAGAERAAAGGAEDRGAVEACREVEGRAQTVFEWRKLPRWNPSLDPVLDMALDHLTLGRARLYRALLEGSAPEVAQAEIEQAVDGLRRAGQLQFIPLGLLTRSWLRSALGDEAGARADLAEAQEIAERGPMPLHLADIALYRARLFSDRAALAEARRLVEKHGYGRRNEELADLEKRAIGW